MARYKVEYEVEGDLKDVAFQWTEERFRRIGLRLDNGTVSLFVPPGATVTEVKPKHPDGWYQCAKTGALFTVNGDTASRLFRYKSGNGASNGATFPVSEKWFKEHTFLGSA